MNIAVWGGSPDRLTGAGSIFGWVDCQCPEPRSVPFTHEKGSGPKTVNPLAEYRSCGHLPGRNKIPGSVLMDKDETILRSDTAIAVVLFSRLKCIRTRRPRLAQRQCGAEQAEDNGEGEGFKGGRSV